MRLPYSCILSLTSAVLASTLAGGTREDYERALDFGKRTDNKVFRSDFEVRWTPDGRRLWYQVQTGPKEREYVAVDLATGKVERQGDLKALQIETQQLTTSAKGELRERPSRNGGAETQLEFINGMQEPVSLFWIDAEGRSREYGKLKAGEGRAHHTFAGHVWKITDAAGGTLAVVEAAAGPVKWTIDGRAKPEPSKAARGGNESPDGKWSIQFRDNNAKLTNRATGITTSLTEDGTAKKPYQGPAVWAPDSQSCIITMVREVARREITIVETSPTDQVQPKLRTHVYQKPGDELPKPQPVLVRVEGQKAQLISDELFPNPFEPDGRFNHRWSSQGDEFYFDYNQRGHQLYRIIGVKAATGTARTVVEETAKTFIDYTSKTWRHWLDKSGELLWMSERDGWAHLWLYDAARGAVKAQVTHGSWVVRQVEKVDEEKREVWFYASGVREGEDPYHRHLCRIGLDGRGFVRLTEGEGDHSVTFSPDRRFFVDKWSRVDLAPIVELRRSDTGALVCELERADAGALLAAGWTVPERFVAKGRDGRTDVHGIIIKPSRLDPAKKYPVLEDVYAGPHSAFAPHSFDRLTRLHALAELGFIIVKADGMGTNHRGKAFHDVAWKNLSDAGFPDRMAWIKAAAATRPWMDLSRVGIFGGSAGGQSAMRALLDHHDFYRAAFADCGCHDNRMDKIWWNEQWMGWPVDESYARNSNVTDASKLQGRLMLCFGELDSNVDPASTMQVVNALEKANKDFDLVIITGAGHGAAETAYGSRKRMDFFVRHLLGVEPPALP